jgi:hypothetical protein
MTQSRTDLNVRKGVRRARFIALQEALAALERSLAIY